MNRAQALGVWSALAQTFGLRFHEQYGEQPNDAWLTALAAMRAEAAMHAIQALIREGSDFPPTLPKFASLADEYRPPMARIAHLADGREPTVDELRQAASPEVAAFGTYTECERWRDVNTHRNKRPVHPTPGSADWLYLRRLAIAQAASGQPVDRVAVGVSEDNGRATAQYEALDSATGLHRLLSPALEAVRQNDPARFEAISAEARRLQALGRPSSRDLAALRRLLS